MSTPPHPLDSRRARAVARRIRRSARLVRDASRLATAVLFVVALAACVSLPVGDQLILPADSIVETTSADCGSGWQEFGLGPDGSRTLDPAGFDLVTWNIHKAQSERWPADFSRIIAHRELILLQEAHLTQRFQAALNASDLRWLMVQAFDLNKAGTGVLTAGGAWPSAACLIRTPEPLILLPKSTLVTRHRLSGTRVELWVANLHGVNFSLGTGQFRRQLESVAAVLAAHPGPLILAGDFNDWTRARRGILSEIAAKLGLVALSLPSDRRSRHFGVPVDHVFFRGLEAIDSASVRVDSSDHHPILARFRLPGVAPRDLPP